MGAPMDDRWVRWLNTLQLIMAGVIIMAPVVWMALSSFKPSFEVTAYPPTLVFSPTAENYAQLIKTTPFFSYAVNSLIVTIGSAGLGLLFGIPAAFAVSWTRISWPAILTLAARMAPGTLFLLPWYMMFRQVGMIGSYTALILSHAVITLPIVIWVLLPSFDNIPRSVFEAAQVDGCSVTRILWRIALPLVGSGIAVAAILAFVFSWNYFLFALVLSNGDSKTLIAAAFNFVGEGSTQWGVLMAAAKRLSIPVFLIGHITKEGTIAGPKSLEHIVDTVLYFEGEKFQNYRLIRAYKNRFGPVNEVALFEMHDDGLEEVANPSAALLAQRSSAAGSAVVAALEGTRPLLIELQALVSATHFPSPRRMSIGVDANRVAVMGFSRGGQAALYSAMNRLYGTLGPANNLQFVAHIAFYPDCMTSYRADIEVSDKPIRILHGSADDYNPVAPCRAYVERLTKAHKDVKLIEYLDAYHVFDAPVFRTPVTVMAATTTRRCQLAEGDDNQIINRETQKPFTFGDECVEKGPTLAYNEAASSQARIFVRDFLTQVFQLKQ